MPWILDQLPVRELDDLLDGAVEKGPVVRDEEIAALERLQELFEELDAGEIEMVGRLVEQQQIDVGQQHAREHGPVLLAAAERRDGPLPLALREPDAGQHPLDLGVQRVAVGMLVVVLQLGVFFEQLLVLGGALRRVGEIVLDRAHLPLDGQHVRERRLDVIEERHPRLGVEMLPDVADGQSRGAQDLAVIGVFLLQQQPEKRRLPRAVAADQTDFLARIVLPRGALDDVVRAVRFLDVVEAVEHCRAINASKLRAPSSLRRGTAAPRLVERRAVASALSFVSPSGGFPRCLTTTEGILGNDEQKRRQDWRRDRCSDRSTLERSAPDSWSRHMRSVSAAS